jgi:SAM-dependent methyltransferase
VTIPPNRWERHLAGTDTDYARVFEGLIARGEDIDGEARLADVLAPRGARILDAGSGLGRVARALASRGHHLTAVEKDPDLVSRSRALFPEIAVVEVDILGLSADLLEDHGRPTSYDVIVLVGNVLIYLAEDTEVRALRTLGGLLATEGRILAGFHPRQGPAHSRDYPVDDFRRHAAQAGLVVEHVFGGYDLRPPADDYVVAVLASDPPLV